LVFAQTHSRALSRRHRQDGQRRSDQDQPWTTDKKEAERRWPEALLKWDALVVEWEGRLNVVALTPERARELAAKWAVSVAGGSTKLDTAARGAGMFGADRLSSEYAPELHAAADAAIRRHADEALKLAGITVAPDTMPLLLEAMGPMVAAAYQQAEFEVFSTCALAAGCPASASAALAAADEWQVVEALVQRIGERLGGNLAF
jgi:hypothetical protein